MGFAGGNNLGVGHCKGEHILLLNSDTLLANNAIRLTLNELEEDAEVGAVSAKLMFPDGRLQFPCRRFPRIGLEVLELLRLHKLVSSATRAEWFHGGYFDHERKVHTDAIWGSENERATTAAITRKSGTACAGA